MLFAESESEFLELVCRYLDNDELTPDEWACLNGELREDRARRETFVRFCLQAKLIAEGLPIGDSFFPLEAEQREGIALTNSPLATSWPIASLFGGPALGVRGYFPQGVLLSYLVATVLFGLALLAGSFITVSPPEQLVQVEANRDLPPPPLADRSEREPASVGRITGMVNCRWADPTIDAPESDDVPLGRKYALASGFMEITYHTGAKVILQGPATYEVESASGGFLSLGKLTARVEAKKGTGPIGAQHPLGRSGQLDLSPFSPQDSGSKGERTANLARSQKEREPTTSLAPRPSLLFSVRTPTAVVTDLGTEFGVEVGKEGRTISHVFRGAVKLQLAGDKDRTQEVVLREPVGLRGERPCDGWRASAPPGSVVGPPAFVRWIVESPKVLDLLDIVAGGNGTGYHRHRGINPVTGVSCLAFTDQWFPSDHQYRPITWHRLIDGVFVPEGGARAVQLDSAGHAFAGFAKTSGVTWGEIWSRSADVKPEHHKQNWIYLLGRRQELTPEGRGLLGLHANAGITFNLEAMRKIYTAVRPARFQATGAIADARPWNPSADGMADVWVFVDGRLKFHHERLRPRDGAFRVDVEIGPDERFLTLVATDGGNGPVCDWLVIGDPVLQMTSADRNGAFPARNAQNPKEAQRMKQ